MKKQWKRLLALLMVLTMCVAVLPGAALAEDEDATTDETTTEETTESSKTLTVDASATEVEGETYTTIQAAINYICDTYYDSKLDYTYTDGKPETVGDNWYLQAQYGTTWKYREYPEEMSGWTITVKSGVYSQFSVYEGLDGITIQAADNASVTINTWTGTENNEITTTYATKNASTYRPYTVTVATRNITLNGLNFTVGEYDSGAWCRAAVTSTSGTTGTDNTGLTVKNCTFTNLGEQGCGSVYLTGEIVNNMGIVVGFDSALIENCTFNKFGNAGIAIFADGRVVDDSGVIIRNNTFISCDYAFNCYYGGNSSLTEVADDDIGGTVYFIGNTVTGTSTLRSKVCIMDQGVKGSIGHVVISDNNFIYTMVVVENMDESPCTVNDVLADNTWSNGSFYVEADAYYWDGTYQGTLTTNIPDYVYYESPASDAGYWVLNVDLDNLTYTSNGETYYYNTEGANEYVQSVINTANETGSHTLSITYDDEDALVETITALKDCIYWVSSDKTSEPGLEKKILEDGTEVDQTSASTDDTIKFQLTSNVPKGLDTYDEYTLTFHDILDDALTLNEDSFAVTIGGEEITDYTLTISTEDSPFEAGCTFELSIILTDIEGIEEGDEIVVTYTADLTTTTPGAYYNEAWVTYPDDESEHDKVEVDTYGISVFKYNASEYTTEDDGTITYTGLKGAVFALYSDESCSEEYLVDTYTSGDDGYLTISGLAEGTYYLVETEAPSGFVASSAVMEIVLPTDANADTFWAYASVPNAPVPSTGGTGTAMYTTGGVIILLAAGCVFVFSRKKRESD
ncbi:MAG: isopeptide-forming domain-containing fimbrial protein [Oscillospiraceae bacterium]|nr:isopeptide-forming domain-containing fimbrial protein [Oscillospiraceae bacterium]